MDLLYFLVIGFSCGVLMTLGVSAHLKRGPATPLLPPENQNPSPEIVAAIVAHVSEEPLSAKLYRLSQPLETFGDSTAHPGELADRSEFSDAVAILSSDHVSIDVVTQYALGANWTMSCAAFAALGRRSDGEESGFQVASGFGRLRPWPMHFALQYLLALPQRFPAGAPVVCAEKWWIDNLTIPDLFRQYFGKLEQLGDKAEFGTWLGAHHATDTAQIEAFLKSLNLPFATTLIGELKSAREEKMDNAFLETIGRFWGKAGVVCGGGGDVARDFARPEQAGQLVGRADIAQIKAPVLGRDVIQRSKSGGGVVVDHGLPGQPIGQVGGGGHHFGRFRPEVGVVAPQPQNLWPHRLRSQRIAAAGKDGVGANRGIQQRDFGLRPRVDAV